MKRQTESNCSDPITNSLKLVGANGKFPSFIISKSPLRFGQLKRTLSPITQQMLTKQLREMERDKLINRKVYEVVPPKVEYSLTKFGASLGPVLDSWCKWGEKNKKLIQALFEEH